MLQASIPRHPVPPLSVPRAVGGRYVRVDGTLRHVVVQTTPFARPQFLDLPGAIDFAVSKDHPARGAFTGGV